MSHFSFKSSGADSSSFTRTLRRPFGVSLLTAYDAIMLGILPIGVALVHFFVMDPAARPPEIHVLAMLLLSGGILWTAQGTRAGEPGTRYGLVALVTLYYVGLMFGAPYTVDMAGLLHSDGSTMETALRVGRSVFWIGLHGWYLLADPTQDFFDERSQQFST
jgi:hypothetical protein